MNEIKVRGIVLREDAMGDKDKRVVLLTAEMGKITLLAKGALSPKSKVRTLTSQFSYGEYVLTKGKTFYYIKEGTLIESFYGLRQSIERLAYGSWMLEVAEVFSLEGQENSDLLQLILRGLYYEMKSEPGMEALPADITVFRVLAENGFFPELTRCRENRGGEEEAPYHPLTEEPVVFLPAVGSLICAACARRGLGGAGIRLSLGALAALRYTVEQPVKSAYAFTVSEAVGKQIHEAVTDYLLEQTDHSFTSLNFISKIAPAP